MLNVGRCLLLTLLVAGLHAAAGIEPRISAVVPWGNDIGFVPMVVQVQSPVDREVTLEARSEGSTARVRLAIGGGTTRSITLLLPAVQQYTTHASLQWSTNDGLGGHAPVHWSNSARTLALALVGSEGELPIDPWNDLANSVGWKGYGHGGNPAQRLDADSLPDRWQGYPTALTLVVAPSAQAELSEGQRQAIAAWTLTGGHLVVTQAGQVATWQSLGVRPQVLTGDPENNQVLRERLLACTSESGDQGATTDLPGTGDVAATGFLILAICFALVVGPANLVWASRRNARHRLLITTPVLSLGTCLALVLADIALQGFSLRRQVEQLILIDQVATRSATWTRSTCFAGYTLASLDLDPETEVLRHNHQRWENRRRYYRGGQDNDHRWDLVWSDRLQVGGTIVPARTNATLAMRRVAPERRRLDVSLDGQRLSIVNGLDVAVRSLVVKAPDGRCWILNGLDAGAAQAVDPDPAATDEHDRILGLIRQHHGSAAERAVTLADGDWHILAVLAAPLDAIGDPAGSDDTPPNVLLCARIAAPKGRP